MSTPPESFVVAASEKSDTILTSFASCVAVPKSVTPVAANDGAATNSASAQVAAKSSSRFIYDPQVVVSGRCLVVPGDGSRPPAPLAVRPRPVARIHVLL